MFPKMYNFAEYENWLFMVQWDKLFFSWVVNVAILMI